MWGKQRKTPVEKEWELLLKKEAKLYKSKQEKKDSKINQLLAEKVPEKLQQTLDVAFYKAFLMIFEKGIKVIEKTYEKKEMETAYKIREYEEELRHNKKSLKAFSKQANSKVTENVLLSGVSGIGMGILGIGLPDIPVFTGMLFRSIYEIALSYGYEYESEQEQYFIVKSMLEKWETKHKYNYQDYAIKKLTSHKPMPKGQKSEYDKALDKAYTFIWDGKLVNLNYISENIIPDVKLTADVKAAAEKRKQQEQEIGLPPQAKALRKEGRD